jgi:hypothetical protein
LAPLDAALAAAKVPLVHWRLAGPADRPTRLLARRGDLLARHGGGSELFQRGEPVPARLNHVLLSALLQEPGVVAVARQDSGTALLVVRALDGQLVLDHFAYPPVDPQLHPLLAHLDNAQVDRYRAMLAAPADRRRLALDPAEGTLVELDAAALERVRTGHALASRLAAGGSEPVGERAPSIFDRVTFQVPFGHEGETAHARMQLSEHAVAWAQGEREDAMAPWVLASVGDPSAPAPDGEAVAPLDEAPDLWFGGASVVLEVMAAIERDAPGSLAGTRAAWTVSIPSGPLPGEFVNTPPSLKRLRERLSKRPHTLRGVLEASVLELTLAPG